MATLTIDLFVFGPLLPRDKSVCGRRRENQSRGLVNVGSLPNKTSFISILDDRKKSIIMPGSGVSRNCQHKGDNMTANLKPTHSIKAKFIDLYQVIIMNDDHVTVRCPLRSSRQDQARLRSTRRVVLTSAM